MAANMLSSYYSCGCHSEKLFSGLKIEKDPSFGQHLNRRNEHSLTCTILIAYYAAKAYYLNSVVEFPSGKGYTGDIILVGIAYDKKKEHEYIIEKITGMPSDCDAKQKVIVIPIESDKGLAESATGGLHKYANPSLIKQGGIEKGVD